MKQGILRTDDNEISLEYEIIVESIFKLRIVNKNGGYYDLLPITKKTSPDENIQRSSIENLCFEKVINVKGYLDKKFILTEPFGGMYFYEFLCQPEKFNMDYFYSGWFFVRDIIEAAKSLNYTFAYENLMINVEGKIPQGGILKTGLSQNLKFIDQETLPYYISLIVLQTISNVYLDEQKYNIDSSNLLKIFSENSNIKEIELYTTYIEPTLNSFLNQKITIEQFYLFCHEIIKKIIKAKNFRYILHNQEIVNDPDKIKCPSCEILIDYGMYKKCPLCNEELSSQIKEYYQKINCPVCLTDNFTFDKKIQCRVCTQVVEGKFDYKICAICDNSFNDDFCDCSKSKTCPKCNRVFDGDSCDCRICSKCNKVFDDDSCDCTKNLADHHVVIDSREHLIEVDVNINLVKAENIQEPFSILLQKKFHKLDPRLKRVASVITFISIILIFFKYNNVLINNKLVKLNLESPEEIYYVGNEYKFKVTGYNEANKEIKFTPIWSINNEFHPDEVFKFTQEGKFQISVSNQEKTVGKILTVNVIDKNKLTKIVIESPSRNFYVGQEYQFNAVAYNAQEEKVDFVPLWIVNNHAEITQNGIAKFKLKGDCTITVINKEWKIKQFQVVQVKSPNNTHLNIIRDLLQNRVEPSQLIINEKIQKIAYLEKDNHLQMVEIEDLSYESYVILIRLYCYKLFLSKDMTPFRRQKIKNKISEYQSKISQVENKNANIKLNVASWLPEKQVYVGQKQFLLNEKLDQLVNYCTKER